MRSHLSIIAAVFITACADTSTVGPDAALTPNFSVTVTGDQSESRTGITRAFFHQNGWSEESNGSKYASDVTLLLLADQDLTKPQTNLGLLGRPRVGTYRVRIGGTTFGTTPEFYGTYHVRNADGTSSVYSAGSGTVTITDVAPQVRGTFRFHASHMVVWPANPIVGTRVSSQPASLDVTGTFVATPP